MLAAAARLGTVEKKRSKTRSTCPGGNPGPRSSTLTIQVAPSEVIDDFDDRVDRCKTRCIIEQVLDDLREAVWEART